MCAHMPVSCSNSSIVQDVLLALQIAICHVSLHILLGVVHNTLILDL